MRYGERITGEFAMQDGTVISFRLELDREKLCRLAARASVNKACKAVAGPILIEAYRSKVQKEVTHAD